MGTRGPRGHGQGHRPQNIVQLRANVEPAPPAAELPAAPKGLLLETQAKWDMYWRSEIAAVLHHVDRGALERLFWYYDEWQRSMNAVRRKRFVDGSTKQPRVNPAASYAIQLEPLIQKLEAKLGIYPLDRERLGVTSNNRKLTAAELNRITSEQPVDKPAPRRKVAGTRAKPRTLEGQWEAVE